VSTDTASNSECGTLQDVRDLVEQIHEMDMHVIIDWVANHTAWDHPWTEDHPDFYFTDSLGNFTPPFNTDWTDVIQLDYENKDLWNAMIAEMKFWVQEMNVDGFRCDVAYLVPTEFWNQARESLESVKGIFMLAEADHPELNEHAFNAGYSWISHHAMNGIAQKEDSVASLYRYFFEENMGNYPEGTYKINFISNHDENSWAGTVFERMGEGMEAFAVLSNTVPSMFFIYNGQEAGLNKRLEFFEKDQINWENMEYVDFYTKLFELKENNRALWNGSEGGDMQFVSTNLDHKVYAFTREKEGDKVLVLTNLSDEVANVEFTSGDYAGTYTELFSGSETKIDDRFSLELQPWQYKVWYLTVN
jgi:glycosidase